MPNTDHYDAIYSQDFQPTEVDSHGWIQWKGTNACIDLHCVCGYLGHVDGDFFYGYQCPSCLVEYAVGQNIKLIPLTKEQSKDYDEQMFRPKLEKD